MQSITDFNKAIVDQTSPELCTPCTPVTPFSPICDAAYDQCPGGGLSHGHRQHAQKIWLRLRVWFQRYPRGQTDTQTDILITVLCNRSRGQSNKEALLQNMIRYFTSGVTFFASISSEQKDFMSPRFLKLWRDLIKFCKGPQDKQLIKLCSSLHILVVFITHHLTATHSVILI